MQMNQEGLLYTNPRGLNEKYEGPLYHLILIDSSY